MNMVDAERQSYIESTEMSTFLGQIEEIPGISVDRFTGANLESSAYFLSHCHTDHMVGLGACFFQSLISSDRYLYCSPISKAFLLGIYPGIPEDRIIDIQLAIPKIIEYKITKNGKNLETSLTVTTTPTGHCPGSVMFIFEKEEKVILYTGDFRINPKDLEKLNPLNDKIAGKNFPKKFDVIYLDTTFLSSNFPSFPSRKESFEEISSAIKHWLESDPKNIVILECSANYGVEYLFTEVSKLLETKIHVKDQVYMNYTRIPELAVCATSDGRRVRVHACASKMSRDKLWCRSDVDLRNILTIVPSVQRWRGRNLNKFSEFDPRNRRRLYVCYSMHSSLEELRAFIDYFKPNKVVPCVCPPESQNEIYALLYELTSYHRAARETDRACNDYRLAVPMARKISSKKTFKSKYFGDDEENDY